MPYIIQKEYLKDKWEDTIIFNGIAYYPSHSIQDPAREATSEFDDLEDAKAIMLATADFFKGVKIRIFNKEDGKVVAEKQMKINHLKEVKTNGKETESRNSSRAGGKNVASIKSRDRGKPSADRQSRISDSTGRSKRKIDESPKKDKADRPRPHK